MSLQLQDVKQSLGLIQYIRPNYVTIGKKNQNSFHVFMIYRLEIKAAKHKTVLSPPLLSIYLSRRTNIKSNYTIHLPS